MAETLARAKAYMQSSDYSRAIVLLQRARNMCKCISVFRENHKTKEHSSAKACLRDSLLSAALSDDEDDYAVFKAATSPCSCGVAKLSCEDEVHMDVLDKLAACSAAMGKNEAAIGFAAAAIHLNPKSPVGYCRLSKLIRTKTLDEATLRSDVDNEIIALAIVRHGVSNVKAYGDVQHPLYQVLRVISRKLYRKDPLKVFPPELKVMILSHLDTLSLIRCQRVSKRWLFAIRDDPNLFLKLVFIFTGKYKPERITKGMLKVISRYKRASTLSLSPAIFTSRHYELIFSHLKDLRHLHLHLQSDMHIGFDDACADPPTRLTRLTFAMPSTVRYSSWLMSLVKASASTLEELQISAQVNVNMPAYLPRLKILRMSAGTVMGGLEIHLDLLGSMTPNLEQLCIEGRFRLTEARDSSSIDSLYPNSPRWPKLKVLVVSRDVNMATAPRLDRLVPAGIQVLDILEDYHDDWFFENVDESTQWAELRFFRSRTPLGPEKLARILGPSLANGKLKSLSLALEPDELDQLPFASQHIQALGLAFKEHPGFGTFNRPRYPDCVSNFPNAHTFAVSGLRPQVATSLYTLVLRPGTKTIFEGSIHGVERDQVLEEAKKRNVDVIRGVGFPVVFPWRFEDDGMEGNVRLVDYGDVVEQWRHARGRVMTASFGVANQPFFRD
ncbi:hypothetical protein CONLIGDRAFT_637649 [Coniochaeta ligniaria NRRL 30616]|uniref:F-box domain-containing protein n=1 Tax=Coniochaeta ligniaria NRRL 30616 TaxID=1408157 RepID=A0A1J7I7P8_9PEZI|nr:hypothetical protein CONLIGDRAFT_637649 [Coniochaeta ligniaria NRRL 30616]